MSPLQSSNQSVSWPHILTVALLTIGAIAAQWDILPDRPIPSGQGMKTRGFQDIDARLWQDPFGPISKLDSSSDGAKPRTLADLKAMARNTPTHVIAVLVSGGKWVGADETRRRARYATLSGLLVEGYTPRDPEHIGYVEANVLEANLRMPYEWLEYSPSKREKTKKERAELAVILWVDEDALLADSGGPLARLEQIRSQLTSSSNFSFSIIGPSSSTLLVAANEEIGTTNIGDKKLLSGTPWYSPLATLPDQKIQRFLGANSDANFVRLIARDDQLAKTIVDEIRLRGVGRDDLVTLVGQRDTAYSRELVAQVEDALQQNSGRLISYGYLRGIDGRLPGADKEGKKDDDKNKSNKSGEWTTTERPEGDSQIDYLRRMVGQLERRQRQDGPIRAIGIFGDDYYDKLLIMKALHPAFPQAVFFTTDLNSAMLHPSDNRDTRNLLVASGYGLILGPGLQRGIPPFRDGYQTASFVAARLAASSADPQLLRMMRFCPQVFEIGRSAAVPITGPTEADDICEQVENCSTLQLPVAGPGWSAALALPIVMGLLIIAAIASDPVRYRKTRRRLTAMGLTVLAATIAASIALIAWLRTDPALTEPFNWVQGISIWPSELLRLIAAMLSLIMIVRGKCLLARNREDIESRFKLMQPAKPATGGTMNKGRAAHEIWHIYTGTNKNGAHNNHLPFYLRMSYAKTLLIFFALMLCFGLATMALFPFTPPNTPARGELTFLIDKAVLWFAVLAFWSILFFALYETLRANWLASQHAKQTSWPPEIYAPYWPASTGDKPDPRIFNDWLDVRLVAHATEPIQRIVFYPFLALALLILARSSLFDGWHIPGALYIMFGLPTLLIMAAAWPLRTRAEKVRGESLRWLHVRLMEEHAAGRHEVVTQIKTMIEQVQHLKTGAFAPFSERPLFKGVLTLVGSLSGVALLDYANLLGF